jgi:hypothetical protein
MMTTSIADMHFPRFLTPIASTVARIIGLLAVAALLAGCSAVKLGYNNLGEVAYWWLDGYVDFTEEQAAPVREELARLHLWHRTEELPRLQAALRSLEELVPGDISPAQACAFVPQLRERLHATLERAEPAIVALATGLRPDQLLHLERKYQKNNSDFRKDWLQLDPPELNNKRLRQFLERSEMIYGRLDEPQRSALRRQIEQSVFDPQRILAERQRRQQDALQTLRRLAGQPVAASSEASRLMRGLLERSQESPDPIYRSLQQALMEEACRNVSVLHNTTTAAQRETAIHRLRAYQRDLRELSAQR